MDRNRIKMFAAMATAVAVLALGFFVGIQPQLSAASASREQQATVEAQNATIAATIEQLKADNEGMADLKATLGGLELKVPSTASMPSFLNQLDSMAATSGTVVTNFTAADAQAYDPAVVAEPTETETQDAAGDTTGGAAATDAPVPAAASTSPEAPALVTDPSITAANFSTIAISVTVKGSYAAALDFVSRIQSGDRLFGLTSFASDGSSEGGAEASASDSWTISGNVYVLQDAATAQSDPSATTPTTQAQGTDDSTAAGQ